MRILVCTIALALGSAGCADGRDATRKELAAIQQELGRMRAENTILMARIEALEKTRTPKSSDKPSSAPINPDDDRPPLDVLRLSPTPQPTTTTKPDAAAKEDAAPSGEVDQDEPRPVIRSTGRGEVIAQSPRTSKQPSQPRPATTGSGTVR